MKRTINILLLVLFVGTSFNQAKAQAFSGRGSNYTSIGWNLSELNCWYKENNKGLKGRFSPIYNGINFQFEKGLGKWFGMAFNIGAGYAGNQYSGFFNSYSWLTTNNYYRSIAVPIGLQGNFHFFQMIQDLTESSIGADKLDIYVCFGAGAGPVFLLPREDGLESEVGIAAYGDVQLGVRYYPSNNVGFFAQAGYGKSLLNLGIVFHK
jgi:hypothetical protein|tara:strand:+ start:644 stop:1267 length:624 start_codon:yes stop_codon:yes gene_type:complete